MRPGDIVRQKTVGGSREAASLLIGRWRELLRLMLDASMRKKRHSLFRRERFLSMKTLADLVLYMHARRITKRLDYVSQI